MVKIKQKVSGCLRTLTGAQDGPAVGTGAAQEEQVELSRLIDILNDRFGTDFKPADQLNPIVVRVMAEVGIDITSQQPARWSDQDSRPPMSSSPWAAATPAQTSLEKRCENWALPDQVGQAVDWSGRSATTSNDGCTHC